MPPTRRASRDAALVELQRLHAAILASRAQRGAAATPDPAPATPSPEALATEALRRRLQGDGNGSADESIVPDARSRRGWWLAMAAAAIVAGAWVAMTLTNRPEVVTEAAPPAPKATPPAAAAPATPLPDSTAPPIRVTLETIRPAWIRVTVDGERVLEREVPTGEKLSFSGTRAVLVRSGDAGGVRATFNGVDRGPLGRDGWPLTVPFTLDPPAPAAAPQ